MELQRAAVDLQHAAVGRLEPEQQPRQFRAARAQQARDANHFSGTHAQVGRLQLAGLCQPFDLQQRGGRLVESRQCRGPRRLRRQLAPEHRRDQRLRSQVRGLPFAHPVAVAQHSDAVGHRVHLVEEVRHEHDRHALARAAAAAPRTASDLVVVQARGRLVEDQHLRRHAEARAIATICCTATEHSSTAARHVDLEPDAREQFLARGGSPPRQSMRKPCSAPRRG